MTLTKNSQNNDFLSMIDFDNAWVGLYQLPYEAKLKAETYNKWQSESCNSTYRNWKDGQPNHYQCFEEACVKTTVTGTRKSNEWLDNVCWVTHLCVCQYLGNKSNGILLRGGYVWQL